MYDPLEKHIYISTHALINTFYRETLFFQNSPGRIGFCGFVIVGSTGCSNAIAIEEGYDGGLLAIDADGRIDEKHFDESMAAGFSLDPSITGSKMRDRFAQRRIDKGRFAVSVAANPTTFRALIDHYVDGNTPDNLHFKRSLVGWAWIEASVSNGHVNEIDFFCSCLYLSGMFDAHGHGSSSYEHLPFGGHGQSGPTMDSFRGAGLDIPLYRGRGTKTFDLNASARIRRRVHLAVAWLFGGVFLLLVTIGVLLST